MVVKVDFDDAWATFIYISWRFQLVDFEPCPKSYKNAPSTYSNFDYNRIQVALAFQLSSFWFCQNKICILKFIGLCLLNLPNFLKYEAWHLEFGILEWVLGFKEGHKNQSMFNIERVIFHCQHLSCI